MSDQKQEYHTIWFTHRGKGVRIDQSDELAYGFADYDQVMIDVERIFERYGLPFCVIAAPNRRSTQSALWIRDKIHRVFQHQPAFAIDLDLADYYDNKSQFKNQSKFTTELLKETISYNEEDYHASLKRAMDRYVNEDGVDLPNRLSNNPSIIIDGEWIDDPYKQYKYVLVIPSADVMMRMARMRGDSSIHLPNRGGFWIHWNSGTSSQIMRPSNGQSSSSHRDRPMTKVIRGPFFFDGPSVDEQAYAYPDTERHQTRKTPTSAMQRRYKTPAKEASSSSSSLSSSDPSDTSSNSSSRSFEHHGRERPVQRQLTRKSKERSTAGHTPRGKKRHVDIQSDPRRDRQARKPVDRSLMSELNAPVEL